MIKKLQHITSAPVSIELQVVSTTLLTWIFLKSGHGELVIDKQSAAFSMSCMPSTE